jgi:hypothetical protein
VDVSNKERSEKEKKGMDAGETRQGTGRQGQMGDFFVTVDPKNWKQLKKEEEEEDFSCISLFQFRLPERQIALAGFKYVPK